MTLPVSGLQPQGLDVEPAVITDYRGFTALACVAAPPPSSQVALWQRVLAQPMAATGRLGAAGDC